MLSAERSFEVSHPVMYNSTLFIFTQRPCSRSASSGLISTPSPPLRGDESVVSREIRFSLQGVPKKVFQTTAEKASPFALGNAFR